MRPWVGVCACACVRSRVYIRVSMCPLVGVCVRSRVYIRVCIRVYAYVCAYLQKSLRVVAVRTMRAVCHTSLHNFNSHEEIGNWHACC